MEMVMKKGFLITAMLATITLSGCATSQLISGSDRNYSRTETKNITLVEDTVLAFGKPAQAMPSIPANSVVIVGEKHSYVLTSGGQELAQLLSNLDPRYIQVTKGLNFYSEKNDGNFKGALNLSYTRLKDDLKKSDVDFIIRNRGKDCSQQSDEKMNAQKFCFNIDIQGGVYPAVNNLALIQSKFKHLSKPYSVSIYTSVTEEKKVTSNGVKNPVTKLVLLPFALAFDVITLPLQLVAGDSL